MTLLAFGYRYQRYSCQLLARMFLIVFLVSGDGAAAGEYSPPGLYDMDFYNLDNGMSVVLKPRKGARTVAFRIRVGVGQLDYACGRQETPHFLEHLLFTGTRGHSESELDEAVEQHGGSWNAFTSPEETVYEMDIYSEYWTFGINTLYEIFSESLLSNDDVETTRDIIIREAGGAPSAAEQWLRRNGIVQNALTNTIQDLLPGSNLLCTESESAEDITREDIINAYERYYVPGNMMLIAVGDFNPEKMRDVIKSTFGLLPARTEPVSPRQHPSDPVVGDVVSSALDPVISGEATVGLAFRSIGHTSPDFYIMQVLEEYLSTHIYNAIRIDEGLAYSPGSQQYSLENYGVFLINADVDLDNMDAVLDLMHDEINKLVTDPPDDEEIMQTKRKLLLAMVQGHESNSDIADYYVDASDELLLNGKLDDREARIESVTPDDVHRVASLYLAPGRTVVYQEAPTITFDQLYTGLVMLILGGVVVIILVIKRHVAGYQG